MNKPIPALVAAIACLLLAVSPARAAERVALVIGNGAYENADPLPNPPNDARAVSGALRNVGFEVVEGVDLDRRGMERAIRDFLREATDAKIALMFYAGHGMQVGGRNYLVPVDAALREATDLSFETIQLDTVLDNLNEPGRANIIVLDACRNNPLSRSFR
ncbi:MAG: caspase family protein, partial [Pseudomonadota bacterium]|nr:caspase family protein [Pseudomonadota bacterium]